MATAPTDGNQTAGFLDTATGLPLSARTRAALDAAWDQAASEPGRRYPSARRSRLVLDQSRASTALAFGVPPDGLYFAPDRLTAINWALTSAHSTHPRLVVSAVEDLMVLRTADHLAATALTSPPQTVAVDRAGRVDLDQLTALLRPSEPPAQVVIQDGNIEIGTRQDLASIRAAARDHVLVTDLQAVAGRAELGAGWDVGFADARMWGGPPGVSVVAVRDPQRFRPAQPITAGHGGVEAEDPPVPLIAAAAMALEDSLPQWRHTGEVTDRLRSQVVATIPDATFAGSTTHRVPYLTMFSFLYVPADELVDELGRRGWAVSSGASCTSDTQRPHHVLVAVGALTHGSLRVSVTPTTTTAEIDDFVTDLADIVSRIRTESGTVGL